MSAKCHNHPGAPAIEECAKCAIALCGMCATFTDTGVFCEACAENVETEKSIAAQSQKLEQKEAPAEAPSPIEEFQPHVRTRDSDLQLVPLTITVVCVGIIAARFLFFTGSDFEPLDDEVRAQRLLITPFQECIRVFEEIGSILARGGTPPASLKCDASGQDNLVTENGNNIIVEHPQPDFYGYSRIYVSRNSPEPTVEE